MKSKITGGETTFLFKATLMSKYEISYFSCNETGFVQTEDPHWLNEAYDDAITQLDLGLVQRNMELSEIVPPIIYKYFNHNEAFLDYAGGYGLFTRMMRNKGFDFYHTDKYCKNIFATGNDASEFPEKKFELTTAFEVFEHLADPISEIELMLTTSPNLFFSTVLMPDPVPMPQDWWYYSLETGQHISFYTISSLKYLAKKYNKYFYSNHKNLHLFSEKKLSSNPFHPSMLSKFFVWIKRKEKKLYFKKGLLDNDIEIARKKLLEKNSYGI